MPKTEAPDNNLKISDGLLQWIGLWGFAVAQPIYDLVVQHSTILTAHKVDFVTLLLTCGVLSLVLPAVIILPILIVRRLVGKLGAWLFGLMLFGLAVLMMLPIVWRLDLSAVIQTLILVTSVALLVFLYRLGQAGPLLLKVLAATSILFPYLFLSATPVSQSVGGQFPTIAFTAEEKPNIVFLVFDEFPTYALTGGGNEIHARLFPNFQRLAEQSTWYSNASAVTTQTERAIPAMLTGQRPKLKLPKDVTGPNLHSFPNNLFTMLGSQYDLVVFESVTGLCPPSDCHTLSQSDSGVVPLLSDLIVAFSHTVLPPQWRHHLPDIGNQWKGFEFGNMGELAHSAIGLNRSAEVDRFIGSLQKREQPSLYFAHFVLPHAPYSFTPSGNILFRHEPLRALHKRQGEDIIVDDKVALAELRHLFTWQLRYVDNIVGQVLDRLEREGLLESTLLIVTADHGISLSPGNSRRRIDATNAADITSIPLFVKTPGQKMGSIVDRNVENIDIVATIAQQLGSSMPWESDSISLMVADRPNKTIQDVHEVFSLPHNFSAESEAIYARWNWLEHVFRPTKTLGSDQVVASRSFSAQIVRPQIYKNVHNNVFLPLIVRGVVDKLPGVGDTPWPVALEVEVNQQMSMQTHLYAEDDVIKFVSFVAEDVLADGFNQVKVIGIFPDGHHKLLYDNQALMD